MKKGELYNSTLVLKMPQQPPNNKMTVIQSKLSYELGRCLGYQGPRKVNPPIPCDKSARWNHVNIIQINISGLQHKVNELLTETTSPPLATHHTIESALSAKVS